MLKIFKKYKKIWLAIILIIIILIALIFIKNFLELRKEFYQLKAEQVRRDEIERTIAEVRAPEEIDKLITDVAEKEMEKCRANFDLKKLDFTAPIWGEKFSTMIRELFVMQAVKQNNRELCDYAQQEKEKCQRDYDFYFILTEKLTQGMDSKQYIERCQKNLSPFIEPKKVLELETIICPSFYQSFQNKTAVISNPSIMCDGDPDRNDIVEYFNPQANQIEFCASAASDEIKFLIAIAKNNPFACLDIRNVRTSQYCQFYFDRNFAVTAQNKFREDYCNNIVHNVIIPNLFLNL